MMASEPARDDLASGRIRPWVSEMRPRIKERSCAIISPRATFHAEPISGGQKPVSRSSAPNSLQRAAKTIHKHERALARTEFQIIGTDSLVDVEPASAKLLADLQRRKGCARNVDICGGSPWHL